MNTIDIETADRRTAAPKTATQTAPTATVTHPATGGSAQSDRTPDYAIYKPNSRGSGGVIRFGLNKAKAAMFVDAANQSGEKQFDWDAKITMKWTLSDLGPVLATLQGRQPQVKLFHQSEKANSAFELSLRDDPERAPYLMSISRQNASDKSLRKVAIPLSHGEAAVLESALRAAITRLLRW
jgi:hypothetical protein